MQNLKLKVKNVIPGGKVVLRTDTIEFQNDGKKITAAQVTKLKDQSKLKRIVVDEPARLIFKPLAGDKTVYKVGDTFEVTVKKAK